MSIFRSWQEELKGAGEREIKVKVKGRQRDGGGMM